MDLPLRNCKFEECLRLSRSTKCLNELGDVRDALNSEEMFETETSTRTWCIDDASVHGGGEAGFLKEDVDGFALD